MHGMLFIETGGSSPGSIYRKKLTVPIQGYDEDHLAWLYNKASLHAIDRFFMQVRRRLSLLERPISSSASLGRSWFGYGPYKPVVVGKLLHIFRVFYNFVEVGK